MNLFRFSLALSLLLALRPAPVVAQAKCEIEVKKPNQLKDASNALDKAELPIGKPDDKYKSILQAVTLLTKEQEKLMAANPTGRAFALGRAMSLLAERDTSVAKVVKRGAVGYVTEPDGSIDLLAAVDSAFDVVEAANAACKMDTEEYRRRVYAPLVNEAVNAYNKQSLDVAALLVRRGLQVYDGYKLSYIAYNILGNVQQARDSLDSAVHSFAKMAEMMKGDTALAVERQSVMLNVGTLIISHADNLEGDAKKAKFAEAVTYYGTYLKEFPDDAKAQGALARSQIASGHADEAEKVFSSMIANPDKFSDQQLFEAGVNAARADRPVDAGGLFEQGLKKNAMSRDGLFNYAVTLQKLDKWLDVAKILDRLIAVDPENPDNYQLYALYYQHQAKLAKDAAAKKPNTSPEAKAYVAANDSLLKYFKRMQEAPVKVTFNLWAHEGTKSTLAGSIENTTDAAKNYTMNVEFLDTSGAKVGDKAVVIEGVTAKGSKAFRVEIDAAGVVAYRYTLTTS